MFDLTLPKSCINWKENWNFILGLTIKSYRAQGKVASLQLEKLGNIPSKSEDRDRDNEEDAFIEQPADTIL